MAKSQKRKIGDIGEDITVRYMENGGFSIVERNYWQPWGEIDVVCKRGDTLHFVEVKSVSREPGTEGIRPEENMHPAKLKRLHRAVQTYLMEKRVGESVPWQIDLVCVFINHETKQAKIKMMQNIVF